MNELHQLFDALKDSPGFWVIAGLAALIALTSLVKGSGRRG